MVDAGCGEGYGADLLATVAARVIGLDYEPATAAHAGAAYPRIAVARANLARIPLRDGAVDVLAALQVVEHLWDQRGFLAEAARILRPAGTLVLSTPNRLTFSPDGTANPFHARELSPGDLSELITGGGFGVSRLYGVRHGRRLLRVDRRHGGSLVAAQLRGPAATWDPALRADVASVRAADFAISSEGVDTSLDLLAIAVRR